MLDLLRIFYNFLYFRISYLIIRVALAIYKKMFNTLKLHAKMCHQIVKELYF
jgi:hypothetical protein